MQLRTIGRSEEVEESRGKRKGRAPGRRRRKQGREGRARHARPPVGGRPTCTAGWGTGRAAPGFPLLSGTRGRGRRDEEREDNGIGIDRKVQRFCARHFHKNARAAAYEEREARKWEGKSAL